MLIEKAYAKVFGSYENIESGLTGMAMMTITGAHMSIFAKIPIIKSMRIQLGNSLPLIQLLIT